MKIKIIATDYGEIMVNEKTTDESPLLYQEFTFSPIHVLKGDISDVSLKEAVEGFFEEGWAVSGGALIDLCLMNLLLRTQEGIK